ncbi:ester cyclase [Embleya scabrispora]|uniref:ester cyclase n=1 Tax=Embleya scabrispora TaxID=159449 RepID=UPI00039AFB1C|nr:nuclear transport factor 2 family protein [Embleya scabrispora]MYS84628.1 DUF4440 domain-containing protein [Streptomyces sp. SID5474]
MNDDTRSVAQRMYKAFNTRDFEAAHSIFSVDFVSHPLGTTGVEAVVKSWTAMHTAFPDARVTVEDMIVQGEKIAVRTTLHGIPADVGQQGAPPEMMEIFRVRAGRIDELWGLASWTRPCR